MSSEWGKLYDAMDAAHRRYIDHLTAENKRLRAEAELPISCPECGAGLINADAIKQRDENKRLRGAIRRAIRDAENGDPVVVHLYDALDEREKE